MSKKIFPLALLACALLSYGAYFYFDYESKREPLSIAHGSVDIRQANLSFQIPGRITQLYFDEGEKVKEGDVLAKLDTKELDLKIKIEEQNLKVQEAKLLELENGYEKGDINMALYKVQSLENALEIASLTSSRYEKLYKSNSISKQERDEAYFNKEQIKAELLNARSNLEKLRGGYRKEAISSQKAVVAGILANIDYLNYQKNDLSILKAPFSGQIRARLSEVGDLSSPNSCVYELSIIDLKRVRVYASLIQIQNIKLGDSAFVKISDEKGLAGKVAYISNTAMFTPKTVETEDLRSDLVYEIRIDVKDPKGSLRLGQPVTVDFNYGESN